MPLGASPVFLSEGLGKGATFCGSEVWAEANGAACGIVEGAAEACAAAEGGRAEKACNTAGLSADAGEPLPSDLRKKTNAPAPTAKTAVTRRIGPSIERFGMSSPETVSGPVVR